MTTRKPRILPGLTKTQALRQAKSATVIREYEQKQETVRPKPQPALADPGRRRRYTPAEPRRVDFSKPAMTKAMMARMKHAEKFQRELFERKQEETMRRRPRRTPAPIGGDPRFGRERLPPTRRAPTPSPPVSPPRPTRMPERRVPEPLPAIPERTKELARSMNAQVIQAEPVGEGPIDSIVIPPRSVDENRTTIVSIPQPPMASMQATNSEVANRSIRVISETLDEQDAAEASAVQGKLEDLQQARRDFVMAVANVGGNAVQLAEEERPRYVYRVPDIESEMFRVEYGREHPSVVAAREFAQRSMAGIRAREEARRYEREFERRAQEPLPEDLRFDVPFEEEFLREGDISWEEEEDIPVPTRIKATMRDIPRREAPYEYRPFDPEELERFFDVEQYPPVLPRGPPPGREHLPPELWEIEDPWATCGICPKQEVSDLIRFESP
ncbi:titin [Solenopsis invicta]|uniref:titin n=1 Tax=Solenopsis invicta TaxID=13686 RepID=UPI0001FEEEA5|nr:titin [Solenopsis invicta]